MSLVFHASKTALRARRRSSGVVATRPQKSHVRAAALRGGHSFQGFLGNIRNEAIAMLDDNEKAALAPILEAPLAPLPPSIRGSHHEATLLDGGVQPAVPEIVGSAITHRMLL